MIIIEGPGNVTAPNTKKPKMGTTVQETPAAWRNIKNLYDQLNNAVADAHACGFRPGSVSGVSYFGSLYGKGSKYIRN